MKFAFIRAEKAQFPIAALCRVLGVTRQGYYAMERRGLSERAKSDVTLQAQVREIHEKSRETYGSPRIRAALSRQGTRVGKTRAGHRWPGAASFPRHDALRPEPPRRAEPACAGVLCFQAERALGHGHHVHQHRRGLVLPRRDHRPLLASGRRLVTRQHALDRVAAQGARLRAAPPPT